jgi:hypothetical protein
MAQRIAGPAILASMHEKPGKLVPLVVTIIVALPLLYFLSLGPALVLLQLDAVSPETFTPAYRPLGWLAERSPTFKFCLLGYGRLWLWRADWIEANP